MEEVQISRKQVDALLAFLPAFETPGRVFIERWAGGQKTADGAFTVPYPIYSEDVQAFFHQVAKHQWIDFGYNPTEARAMLSDDEFIEQCNLADIKTMLTYCVRGERFSDGFWGSVLETGRVNALLRRLAVLRDSIPRKPE